MMKRADQTQMILREKVVGIIRIADGSQIQPVMDAIVEGGLRVVEVTMTVPNALDIIRQLRSYADSHELLFGAGTVLDAETARMAILAGADFIVSPVLRPEVIQVCNRYGASVMPGCATPTEMLTAWELGADFIKVFPVHALGGPEYIKAVLAPLPQLRLLPTGGITAENAASYIKAGCAGVGAGYIVNNQLLRDGNFAEITNRCRKLKEATREV